MNKDVLLIGHRCNTDIATTLAGIIESCGLSVWYFESSAMPGFLSEEDEKELNSSKCVVVLWSEHSSQDNIVKKLALASLKNDKLISIKVDECILPAEFNHVQNQRIDAAEVSLKSWDCNPDEGLYKMLIAIRKATGKDFQIAMPLSELNKAASRIYVKKDGKAYLYHGVATTTWLQSRGFDEGKIKDNKKR